MGTDQLDMSLLVGSVVILTAIAAVRLTAASSVPALLLFLGIGVGIGEAGLGIRFDNVELTQALGYTALVVILAEGGVTTRWSSVRPAIGPALALSLVGVAMSVTVVGVAARLVLDLPWATALLLGAILSSTDAAAVFSLLRRLGLPSRLRGLLEAESGINDAPVVLLVVALAERATGQNSGPWWMIPLLMVGELIGGAAVGLAVGALGAVGLRRFAPASSALTAVAVLTFGVCAYAIGAEAHVSGFLAVYVTGLVLGNTGVPHGPAVRGFAEGLGWLAQIGLFVLLGLLSSPARLGDQILPALIIGMILTLIARPLGVFASLTPARLPWRVQAFVSWAGLRGAVPVVLATVPITAGVPGATDLLDLVFVLVVLFTLLQGPLLPWVARSLRVASTTEERDLSVESAPLMELNADVVQAKIGPSSALHGLEVFELRLPAGANLALIVRDGTGFVPGSRTTLRHGDQLLLVTTNAARAAARVRLEAISRGGRLALWTNPDPHDGNPPKQP
ncbi:MAG: potassium/proton antiporter [Actinomycetota bacterium]